MRTRIDDFYIHESKFWPEEYSSDWNISSMTFKRKRKYEQTTHFLAVVMKYVICIAHHAIRFGMAHSSINKCRSVSLWCMSMSITSTWCLWYCVKSLFPSCFTCYPDMSKTRGLRSLAARQVVREKKIEASQWHCCNTDYTTMESISRHVYACHELDIAAWETRLKEQRQGSMSCSSSESDMAAFQRRRAPKVCCCLIV